MKIKALLLALPMFALVGCSQEPNAGDQTDLLKDETGEKLVAYFEEKLGKQHSYQWMVVSIDNVSDSSYNLGKVQLDFSRKILRDGGDSGNIDGYEYSISLKHKEFDYQANYYLATAKTMENHPVAYRRNQWVGGGMSYTALSDITISDVTFDEKKVLEISFEGDLDESRANVAHTNLKYMIDAFSDYCARANLDLPLFE